MSESVLDIHSLSKTFPGKPPVQALSEVSFSLQKGEILGLLGPNGAGKTTVIRILISLLKQTSGRASIMGYDIALKRSKALACIGYASTYTNLPYFLTVEQNLDIHGRFYGLSKSVRRTRADELLERFKVENLRSKRISQLSAGQRTRMMLIKAFLPAPPIMLLDEPTASLDLEIADETRNFIREECTQRGLSVLFTSHNMEEVTQLCDRVIFLSRGKIIAQDTPRHLARSVANTQIYITTRKGGECIKNITAKHLLETNIDGAKYLILCPEQKVASLITEIVRAGVDLEELHIDHPTLHDFFIKLVKNR